MSISQQAVCETVPVSARAPERIRITVCQTSDTT